jgi:hypothetical protein
MAGHVASKRKTGQSFGLNSLEDLDRKIQKMFSFREANCYDWGCTKVAQDKDQ